MISLLDFDKAVFFWINSGWSNSILDSMMPWISRAADPIITWLWIVFIGVLSGWRFSQSADAYVRSSQARMFALKAGALFCLYLALIYGVNAGVYKGLKHFSRRSRPFVHETVLLRVSPVIARNLETDGSFPSGHACNAFMGAALLAALFRRKRLVFYGAAAMIALSRVYLGVHYPSDVLVGGCLGLSVTWLMLSFRPLRHRMARENLFASQN